MKVEKVLVITFIFIFILMVFWIKLLGSTEMGGNDVEKNGYCKRYGDDWKNIKETNICRHKLFYSQDIKPIEFTEKEFRDYCPQNNFFSIKFFSDCFHKSRSIS